MFHYFEIARVGSWLGWLFNFGFGSVLFGVPPVEITAIVLFAFSLATASVFVLNQYFDREDDRENEVKSNLPVASGRISPRKTVLFAFFLVITCLVLVFVAKVQVLPLFVVYLGVWTAYSTPPVRLKSVPVVDFVISGIGAGFLPFLIGRGVTDQLVSDGPLIVWAAVPLMLIHCGGHIIQAVGDYDVDRKMGVRTFVVRFGRKKGVIVAGLMVLLACFSPFVYSVFGLLPYRHLLVFFALFPLSVPIIKSYVRLLKTPSTKHVVSLQKTATKCGTLGALMMLGYILLVNAGF